MYNFFDVLVAFVVDINPTQRSIQCYGASIRMKLISLHLQFVIHCIDTLVMFLVFVLSKQTYPQTTQNI
jgi:hypothetical protein